MFPLVILLVWTLEMCSVPNTICPAWLMKLDVVEDESSDIGSTRVLASKLAGERTSHIC